TEQGRHIYVESLEKIDASRGDPKTISATLRLLQTADSRPFAHAGVAYSLLALARESDGSYAQAGLDAAMQWLEQAQEMEPDIVEINVIEALIYIYGGRFDDARLVLDYLQGQEPMNYYLHLAEIAYWQSQSDRQQILYWFKEAMEIALTVPQRLRLRVQMADFHFESNLLNEALEIYREAVHFDRENAQLWHKISLVYLRQENYEEAGRANQMALRLQDFADARQVEAIIKKKTSGTGVLGRLFGRQDD
ncbi:MAG TPA: hypothetical protein VF177_17130, partial [Anaerolineae bacterium]